MSKKRINSENSKSERTNPLAKMTVAHDTENTSDSARQGAGGGLGWCLGHPGAQRSPTSRSTPPRRARVRTGDLTKQTHRDNRSANHK